jgi:hypothetical protein
MLADADRHRFLSDGEMWKTGNLAPGGEPLHVGFEEPDTPERVIHPLPVIWRRRCHEFDEITGDPNCPVRELRSRGLR